MFISLKKVWKDSKIDESWFEALSNNKEDNFETEDRTKIPAHEWLNREIFACGTCPKSHYCVDGLEFGPV